ncbi:hypothetical protein TNCV_2438871 [Trichonephila clavipes]|nr:hypothetical protein TNCV_2438871 [Trichonephila clavipes]
MVVVVPLWFWLQTRGQRVMSSSSSATQDTLYRGPDPRSGVTENIWATGFGLPRNEDCAQVLCDQLDFYLAVSGETGASSNELYINYPKGSLCWFSLVQVER